LFMMSRVYLLLLDRAGQVGGSVEHSEGKGREGWGECCGYSEDPMW
jgi:hypothetical protein